MPEYAPNELSAWVGGQWTAAPRGRIVGLNQDTRTLRPGEVFVALETPKRDGHLFLADAAKAGAAGALVSRLVPGVDLPQLRVDDPLAAFQSVAREARRRFSPPVVGISGSCGKTSTKNLLALLLGDKGPVLATEGNLNNHLGVPLTLQRLEPAVHQAAVIEAGISGPGEMDVLGSMIQPDFGVITLVGPAHLQELGGLEGVAREKARLLHHVKRTGLAVFPSQCAAYAPFQSLPVPSLVVVPEGEACSARWQMPYRLEQSGEGSLLHFGRESFALRPMSPGMAGNAALALVVARELGVSVEALRTALARWRPAPLRGEVRVEGSLWCYLDCYNANPASMADAFSVFNSTAPRGRPRLYLLGGMEELGDGAAHHHRSVGRLISLREGDELWLIGPHSAAVAAGARETSPHGRIEILDTLAPAAAHLRTFEGAVLVKGSRRYALEQALPFSADAH